MGQDWETAGGLLQGLCHFTNVRVACSAMVAVARKLAVTRRAKMEYLNVRLWLGADIQRESAERPVLTQTGHWLFQRLAAVHL